MGYQTDDRREVLSFFSVPVRAGCHKSRIRLRKIGRKGGIDIAILLVIVYVSRPHILQFPVKHFG